MKAECSLFQLFWMTILSNYCHIAFSGKRRIMTEDE